MSRLYISLRACAALLLVGALPAQAATIVVASSADGAPGMVCTLRSAVQSANTNTAIGGCVAGESDGDSITFAPTVQTITLTGGEILITDDLRINGLATGAGTTRVVIDGAGNSRIFDVDAPGGTGAQRRAIFANLILRNGNSTTNSSAPDAGGAVDLKSGSQSTFSNVDVLNSICGINGGGIHGAGNTEIVITTTTTGASLIQNNEARGVESNRGGGGVWGAGAVFIDGNVTINNNRATGAAGSGGGVFNLAGQLTIDAGVVISNNTANRAGGGIESAGGTVTLTDVMVTGNNAGTAPGNGGGYHGGGNVTTTVTRGTYSQNVAVEGGGLWISGAGTLALTGTTVSSNTATGAAADQGGGGLYNDGGTLTLNDVDVTSNVAAGASGSGGGILTKGALTISNNSDIRANVSTRAGGGIEVVAATGVSVTGSLISANNAGSNPGFGGGLHITGAGVATVTGGRVFDNTAVEGGGLWKAAPGSLTVDGTDISTNEATGAAADQGGGGVFSDGGGNFSIANASIRANRASGASGSGGGVFNNGGTMDISMTDIRDNTSNRAGGGIEDNAGTGMTLTDVTFVANDAGTAPGNGGGLHISGAGIVTMIGGSATANRAVEGGGLWKSGPGTLTVRDADIVSNVASGAAADQGGGGFYNDGAGGMMTLTGVSVSSNEATGASGSGGGLLNNTGGVVTITDSGFASNVSNRAGGGIEDNAGGLITINRSGFTDNRTGSAPGNGGALHITGAGTVAIDSSAVISNEAVNQGGGLWNSGLGSLTVRDSDISSNQTLGAGGGVYQVAGAKGLIRIQRSLVADNRAMTAGGGMAADGATIVVENTTVSGNMAGGSGGGLASGGGRFLVSSATIAFNQAMTSGGGLFRTTAGGDSLLSLDNTIVSNNMAASGANLSGTVMSRGYNLFRTTAGGTVVREAGAGPDLTGVDPRLQPLADNRGLTETHAVAAGSPAIGAGMTALLFDQRGFVRLMPSTIGAFDFGSGPVAGEDTPVAAATFGLSAPAPNPFRGQTTMRVSTETEEAIEVVLYDALGRRVQTLYAGTPAPGTEVTVDGRALAPGVYVVRMTGATQAATQRITVTR